MRAYAFASSHVGSDRARNEDSYLVNEQLGLYIVCDGLGGHRAGNIASSLAVASIDAFIDTRLGCFQTGRRVPSPAFELEQVVEDAVLHANQEILAAGRTFPECRGMATTATVLLVRDEVAVMGHVGDSRLYVQRGSKFLQLSQDHTLGAELQRARDFDCTDEPRYQNVLTRAVGRKPRVDVDVRTFAVFPDDTFMLCSDGLTGSLEDQQLQAILSEDGLMELLPDRLINRAHAAGSTDDTTVVLIQFEPSNVTHPSLARL